jgi:hypothetical protein
MNQKKRYANSQNKTFGPELLPGLARDSGTGIPHQPHHRKLAAKVAPLFLGDVFESVKAERRIRIKSKQLFAGTAR